MLRFINRLYKFDIKDTEGWTNLTLKKQTKKKKKVVVSTVDFNASHRDNTGHHGGSFLFQA